MTDYYVRRESFGSMPETCPEVDRAFDDCLRVVKEVTGRFRDVLNEWVQRALEAEGKIEDLESKIKDLEDQMREYGNETQMG